MWNNVIECSTGYDVIHSTGHYGQAFFGDKYNKGQLELAV